MLKVKENPNKWKNILYSLVRKFVIVTISILPQLMYSQCNLCQILTGFCVEIDKLIPRFTGKRKGSKVISTILKSERLTLPDFKTFIKLQ